jgi:putative ABC transport system permease protein
LLTFAQDMRQALRHLRRTPGFVMLAALTLTLAIGANTAMFTVAEDVLLRPLPYANADRLVAVDAARPDAARTATSWLNYRDIRDQATHSFAQVGLYSEDIAVVRGGDASIAVNAPTMSPNLLSMLGASPLLGRTFTPQEGESNGPAVVLLSEGLWRDTFHADPAVLGRVILVNAQPRTVVGVMPQSFRFPESIGPDITRGIWMPLQPTALMQTTRGFSADYILGELRPGVTLAQAQAELNRTAQSIVRADPKGTPELALTAVPYLRTITGQVRPVFLGLIAALALILLIACANVANLMIARCLGRQQEFAVRAALGAPRARLIRQMLAEAGVLSLVGCGFGILLAGLLLRALRYLPQGTLPRAESIALDWSVIAILAAVATLTTLLSSILPALLVSRTDPQRALQSASRGLGTRGVSSRLTRGVVVGEVALSTLLLVATGLLFHTLWNLEHTALGFSTTSISSFTAEPGDAAGFSNMAVSADTAHAPLSVAASIYAPVLERLRQAPGVASAALATAPPLSGIDMHTNLHMVGEPEDPAHSYGARMSAASPEYASLLGTPVLRGRMITDSDTMTAPYVVVINQALERLIFHNRDPLGRQMDLGGKATGMLKPYTVVGVLADQKDTAINQPTGPLLLLPYQQIPTTSLYYPALLKTVVNFLVKTRGDVAVAPLARSVFHQVAPAYALDSFSTLQESVDKSNFANRLGLYITGAFSALAGLMVLTGLYGVLAQLVGYRRREIGIRLALGAPRSSVLQMILRQGATMVLVGLGLGVLLSLASGRVLHSFLYGVGASDRWTYAGTLLSLSLIGAAASSIPALRAAHTPPMESLRDE